MKEITLACEAFQKLLEEQLERIRNMNGEKTDFSTKKQVTIGVIDGDGIGPVITAQATRVLEKLLAGAERSGAELVLCNCCPVTEDGAELGKLKEVISTGANDVFYVKGAHEYMIPAVPEFVLERNIDEGFIRVRLIEGMQTDAL